MPYHGASAVKRLEAPRPPGATVATDAHALRKHPQKEGRKAADPVAILEHLADRPVDRCPLVELPDRPLSDLTRRRRLAHERQRIGPEGLIRPCTRVDGAPPQVPLAIEHGGIVRSARTPGNRRPVRYA